MNATLRKYACMLEILAYILLSIKGIINTLDLTEYQEVRGKIQYLILAPLYQLASEYTYGTGTESVTI